MKSISAERVTLVGVVMWLGQDYSSSKRTTAGISSEG